MESSEYTDVQHHDGVRAGIVVSVRLKPDEAELLRALSERDGRTLSETLRVALHTFSQLPRPDMSVRPDAESLTRGGIFVSQPADLMLA